MTVSSLTPRLPKSKIKKNILFYSILNQFVNRMTIMKIYSNLSLLISFPQKYYTTEVCQSRFCESYNKYFQDQDLPLISLTFSGYRKHIKNIQPFYW